MGSIKHTSYAAQTAAKKLILGVLAVICLWWMTGGMISYAQGTGTVDKTVNIREGAGTDYEIIGSAEAGKTVDITGKATASDGKIWYQIIMNADTLGFISSDFISNVSGTINEVSGTVTDGTGGSTPGGQAAVTEMAPVGALVTQDNARVRSVADGSGEMIGDALPVNTPLTVNGETTDGTGALWYRVTFLSGDVETTGFIRGDFITLSGEVAPAGTEPAPEPEVPAQTETKDYDTELVEDSETGEYDWYLLDRAEGYQYKVDVLLQAAENYETNYNDLIESKKTVGSQRIAIVLLVILVGVLMFGIVISFFKLRDAKDEPLFHQMSKPQKPAGRPKENRRPEVRPGKVMQTVGGSPKAPSQPSTPKPPVRPGARPSGSGVPGGKPAGAQNGARPVRPQGGAQAPGRPTTNGASGGAQSTPSGRPTPPPTSRPMPGGRQAPGGKPAQTQRPQSNTGGQAPGWKSRNFMADDDEFEFEFLNMDNTDKGDR
jgi:uncharacterized protein YgiM (DUF1202 family)